VSGVVEVTNVDSPDSDANEGDDLWELLSEFVKLLLEWGLDFLGLRHFGTDAANSGVKSSADNNTASLDEINQSLESQNIELKQRNIILVKLLIFFYTT